MTVIAKFQGKIVEVIRVTDTVGFSKEKGWVCITSDVGVPERKKMTFKWVPASTEFEWVREFKFGE
jgi:hypothetical protein